MSHILITGGAGFIGSHLARFYLNAGDKVTVVDNLSTGSLENLPKGVNFIEQDITSESWTALLPNDVSYVFHFAAQSSGEISYENPVYDVKVNTVATLELLKWSVTNNIKKFVFASSMNVYGTVEDEPITETHLASPESFYAVGKMSSESYMKIYSELGLSTAILRLFNVYGPGQNMANMKQGMVSIYCAFVANKEPVLVKGSENRFRDFVYIADVISVCDLALRHKKDYEIFNVCSGVKTTVKTLLSKIFSAFEMEDYPYQVVDGTPRDQFGIYGSFEKCEQELGWKPAFTLEKGLNEMVSWIKKTK